MQEVRALVSIVIPAYNAAGFVEETIMSVKAQTYSHWEILLIDDGSTDNTLAVADQFSSPSIHIMHQKNAGVSAARNTGLALAKGEYLLFLDADDLLTPDFLAERVRILERSNDVVMCSGLVDTFPVAGKLREGVGSDPAREILLFDPVKTTIPSNYLFRASVIRNNQLTFNTNLSSTADRFFLLEVERFGRAAATTNMDARLLYRVHPGSMSGSITPALIYDNELFYNELKKKGLLPESFLKKFKGIFFYSLGVGFIYIKKWPPALKYLLKSFSSSPVTFMGILWKKVVN